MLKKGQKNLIFFVTSFFLKIEKKSKHSNIDTKHLEVATNTIINIFGHSGHATVHNNCYLAKYHRILYAEQVLGEKQ